MGRPARSKAVRAVQKVLLVDRLQDHRHRPLEDFVLERRDPNGPGFFAGPLGDIHPTHRRRPIRAGLGPVQQRLKVGLQVYRVLRGRLSVHADCTVLAGALVGFTQPFQVDQVGQGSETHCGALLRQLCYPLLFC